MQRGDRREDTKAVAKSMPLGGHDGGCQKGAPKRTWCWVTDLGRQEDMMVGSKIGSLGGTQWWLLRGERQDDMIADATIGLQDGHDNGHQEEAARRT